MSTVKNQTNSDSKVKQWEEDTPSKIEPKYWIVIRIDGHTFHTFTKPFDKPVDYEIRYAMIETSKDLCAQFHAILAYTQSDEITLVLSPQTHVDLNGHLVPHIFNGRKQKLESLSAGYASARFNYHLSTQSEKFKNTNSKKYKNMISGLAHFDSRAIKLESQQQVRDVIAWRYLFDCYRNGVSSVSCTYLSHKKILNKNTFEQIEMLKECGVDVQEYPSLLYGTFIKKNMFEMKVQQPTKLKNCNNTDYGIVLRSQYVTINMPKQFCKHEKDEDKQNSSDDLNKCDVLLELITNKTI